MGILLVVLWIYVSYHSILVFAQYEQILKFYSAVLSNCVKYNKAFVSYFSGKILLYDSGWPGTCSIP